MYRFIFLILISALSMPVLADIITMQGTDYNPYYATPAAYYGGDYIPNKRYQKRNKTIFPDINELEKYALNKSYSKDSDRIRLERLETLAFGAVQEGDVYTRYDNVRYAILSRPKNNYKTSIFRSLSNYFNGQLTGYTPSLNDSYNPYSNDFENSSYTEYGSPFHRGYKTNNYGTGSYSGVRILD